MKCKVCGKQFKTKKKLEEHHKSTACGTVDVTKPMYANLLYKIWSGDVLEAFSTDLAMNIQQYGVRNVLRAAINGLEKQKVEIEHHLNICKELTKALPGEWEKHDPKP